LEFKIIKGVGGEVNDYATESAEPNKPNDNIFCSVVIIAITKEGRSLGTGLI
jgi:hypothetical protein